VLLTGLAAAGCGGGAGTASAEPAGRRDVALNSALVIGLGEPVDPLSVTAASVSAARLDGRPLGSRVGVAGGRVVVELVVDESLLADPPEAVAVTLIGLPSPHAVRTLDGRRLVAAARLDFRVTSVLEPRGALPARLLDVDGQPPRPGLQLTVDGPVVLRLDGVLDPASLSPQACPLFPLENGLVLPVPVEPVLSWRCIGDRFELELGLDGQHGRFQLDLRRFRWRDLAGGIPEPTLVAEVAAP